MTFVHFKPGNPKVIENILMAYNSINLLCISTLFIKLFICYNLQTLYSCCLIRKLVLTDISCRLGFYAFNGSAITTKFCLNLVT